MDALQYILFAILIASVLPFVIATYRGGATPRTITTTLAIAVAGVTISGFGFLIVAIVEGKLLFVIPMITLALMQIFVVRILLRTRRRALANGDAGDTAEISTSQATTFDTYAVLGLAIASLVALLVAVFLPVFTG